MAMKIKFKGKTIEIKAYECRGIMKVIGLMFSRQEKASALLFKFGKPVKMAIHSLFCPQFLAVWLKRGRVIGFKLVKSARLFITPPSEFDALLEIPLNKKHQNIVKNFL